MKSSNTDLPVQYVKGIGPNRARLFSKLGINSIGDALTYLPYRYEDRTNFTPLGALRPGDCAAVSGTIAAINPVGRRRRGPSVFEVVIQDSSGYLKLKWFNQPYLQKSFRVGCTVIVSGTVRQNSYDMPQVMMDNPEYEMLADEQDSLIHTRRVVPFYRLTEGMGQKQFRKLMFLIVQEYCVHMADPMPGEITGRNGLAPLSEAIGQLHFPSDASLISDLNNRRSEYHRRLIFDELFMFSLGLALIRAREAGENGISFRTGSRLKKALLKILPYELTGAQKRVMEEVQWDMEQPRPMSRLIQGDVGCGKTVVALAAMLDAVEAGYQAVLMAPTAVLAEQHYINIHKLIEQLGLTVSLLTGDTKKSAGDAGLTQEADIIVGTHALIQEGVKFLRLGLVVVDEQHKFGVVQRQMLRKKGLVPDVLVMTATPIPRSLALTIYGELDCSVIDELPPGRTPVQTRVVEAAGKEEVYELLKSEISRGRQAYVVYPAVGESEMTELKSANRGREAFEHMFPEFRTGLLHGRMKTSEKEKVMNLFKNRELDILVSTTVIEVGVDVANASVMLIVHAERFGLSQLHQLRGRVGRGTDTSFCILIAYPPIGDDARRRLDIMSLTSDGFRIAEEDLVIRGPGEFLGTRQSGLPDLRNADIVRDAALLSTARQEAFCLVEKDPHLGEFPFLKQRVDVFWKGRVDLFKTG